MDSSELNIIGQHTSLADLFRTLEKVAPTDSTVLVTGESGTGKELLVRALHLKSKRKDKPFVPINCGAIPRELLESELFGHEKGAFTHAIRTRPGRFELAEGGTIFLDEIGEMDLLLQVKILRAIQEREIERVGGQGSRKVDVRIIAATNRDLEKEVAAGRFREDLFYRLNVIPLHLPALRDRDGDVLTLTEHFLQKFYKKSGRHPLKLSPQARKALRAYTWPGNVRELENLAERLSILCDGPEIGLKDLPSKILSQVGDTDLLPDVEPKAAATATAKIGIGNNGDGQVAPARDGAWFWPDISTMCAHSLGLKEFLDTLEERLLREALDKAAGIKNQAAEILGIKRTTLIEKLKKRNLE